MGNPLFGGNGGVNGYTPGSSFSPTGFNNLMDLVKQINQFSAGFTGNPQQMVQQLIQNGQMSQEQFNQLSSMAQIFRQILGR